MPARTTLLVLWFIAGIVIAPKAVVAEWYLAGTAGVNFADRLVDIAGTGGLEGVPPRTPHFDLANSISYGAKLGYFPQHFWVGIEGEVLHTTPHIKSLDNDPGIHLRMTTVGVNLIARYPGRTFQPYVGIGGGLVVAHIGDTATVQRDTDVAGGWNLLAGMRAFVTPRIAAFTEYKYTEAKLEFDRAFGAVGGFEGIYRAQHILIGLSYHF